MLEDRFVDVISALKQGTANDIVPWKPSIVDRNNKTFVTAVGDWSYEIRELENGDISLNFQNSAAERLDGFVSPRDDARYEVVEGLFRAARDRHASHVTASLKAAASEIKRRLKEAGLEVSR